MNELMNTSEMLLLPLIFKVLVPEKNILVCFLGVSVSVTGNSGK